MEEFLQMLTEPFYFVNDEGMREGTTHQVVFTANPISNQLQVTMINEAKEDLGEIMLSNGFCTTVKKAPGHLKQLHEQYLAAQLLGHYFIQFEVFLDSSIDPKYS